jgi:osmoprotectant transport system substrate-binding protein
MHARMPTRRSTLLPLVVGAFALLAAACGDDGDDAAGPSDTEPATTEPATTEPATTEPAEPGDGEIPDGPTITIGAQDFGESAILAEVYGQALSEAGYPVGQQALGGFRDLVFTAFDGGDINFTAEYAASALEFLNGFAGVASGDIEATAEALQGELGSRGLVALDASPAVDSNSFVVTQETADELGLTAVSDLTDDLVLGGPPDCPENASCIPGLIDTYGIDLSDGFVPLDGGGPLTVAALEGGEIDVAILFSTDGVIADKGWVVLDDDQGLINADNIIPVTTQEVVDAYGDAFTGLVNEVSAALDTEELTELNRQFGIELRDATDVARDWLVAEGFVSG